MRVLRKDLLVNGLREICWLKGTNDMKLRVKKPNADGRFRVSELLPTGETVVLYGDRRMTVQGCKKILAYSTSEIRLRLKNCILTVRGQGLICSCFSGGCTTLQGKILCVEYQKEQMGGRNR